MNKDDVKYIVVHCSYTPEQMDIGAADIDRWHREKGWMMIGYHKVIRRDGTIEDGRPVTRPGAHTRNWNRTSIGVCYAGGVDEKGQPEDNRTEAQRESLVRLINTLLEEFPEVNDIAGHNEFSNKACPCFNVKRWWNEC